MTDKCDEWDFSRPPKPMTDIIERLRRPGNFEDGPFLMAEAAAEIGRLRNECSNLTEVTLEAGKEIMRLRMKIGSMEDALGEALAELIKEQAENERLHAFLGHLR